LSFQNPPAKLVNILIVLTDAIFSSQVRNQQISPFHANGLRGIVTGHQSGQMFGNLQDCGSIMD
jgi:hypothetical protein